MVTVNKPKKKKNAGKHTASPPITKINNSPKKQKFAALTENTVN